MDEAAKIGGRGRARASTSGAAAETSADGKLRFTPESQRFADETYDALMKAQNAINLWTGPEGLPPFLKKETGLWA